MLILLTLLTLVNPRMILLALLTWWWSVGLVDLVDGVAHSQRRRLALDGLVDIVRVYL